MANSSMRSSLKSPYVEESKTMEPSPSFQSTARFTPLTSIHPSKTPAASNPDLMTQRQQYQTQGQYTRVSRLDTLCIETIVKQYDQHPQLVDQVPPAYHTQLYAQVDIQQIQPTVAAKHIQSEEWWSRRWDALGPKITQCRDVKVQHAGSHKCAFAEYQVQQLLEAYVEVLPTVEATKNVSDRSTAPSRQSASRPSTALPDAAVDEQPPPPVASPPGTELTAPDLIIDGTIPADVNYRQLLTQLIAYAPYVRSLHLQQLSSHLPLYPTILQLLPQLHTLSLTYKPRNIRMNYDKSVFGMHGNDVQWLSQYLQSTQTLTTLSLTENQLSDELLQQLVEDGLLQNTTLTSLNLAHNFIGDNGVAALCQYIATMPNSITQLYLHNNRLTAESGEHISAMLQSDHCQLTSINVSINKTLADDGVASIARALPAVQRLVKLDISNTSSGHSTRTALVQALTDGNAKPALLHLRASDNPQLLQQGQDSIDQSKPTSRSASQSYTENDVASISAATASPLHFAEAVAASALIDCEVLRCGLPVDDGLLKTMQTAVNERAAAYKKELYRKKPKP